jgi:hypothetical protein
VTASEDLGDFMCAVLKWSLECVNHREHYNDLQLQVFRKFDYNSKPMSSH